MTVTELKRVLSTWPEHNEDGEPSEVWIESGHGNSSEANGIHTLGKSDLYLVWTDEPKHE